MDLAEEDSAVKGHGKEVPLASVRLPDVAGHLDEVVLAVVAKGRGRERASTMIDTGQSDQLTC